MSGENGEEEDEGFFMNLYWFYDDNYILCECMLCFFLGIAALIIIILKREKKWRMVHRKEIMEEKEDEDWLV